MLSIWFGNFFEPFYSDRESVLDDRRLKLAEAGKPTDEVAEEFVHEHPDLLKPR